MPSTQRPTSQLSGIQRLLTEPARPERVAGSPNAHWFVVATVCIGAFMGQLDASIVSLAFPTLQQDFGATLGAVEWVALSYLLVLVGTVAAVGRLADMVGRKLLYIYGFGVFTVSSVLCGLAPNLLLLDVFRVVQALGAAMMQANSVALIANAVPAEKLGKGIGIQGAAQAIGLAMGPTVGGLLISLGGWRLIFFVNAPAGVVGIVLGWFLLPRSRGLQAWQRFDWLGLALFLPAVSTLLLALSFGRERGFASAEILLLFVAAAMLGVAFVTRERRASAPMIDPGLFRRLPFSAGIVSGLLSYLVLFGVLFVVPFFLERARHLTAGQAGLVLTALPVALGVVAPVAGHFADRVGARPLTVGGLSLAGAVLFATAWLHGSDAVVGLELAAVGAGLGAFTPPNNAAIMGSAPRTQSGVAAGVLNMTRGVGTALGVALTGLVFSLVVGHTAAGTSRPGVVDEGFTVAVLFLAAMSVAGAVVAGLRGQTALDTSVRALE